MLSDCKHFVTPDSAQMVMNGPEIPVRGGKTTVSTTTRNRGRRAKGETLPVGFGHCSNCNWGKQQKQTRNPKTISSDSHLQPGWFLRAIDACDTIRLSHGQSVDEQEWLLFPARCEVCAHWSAAKAAALPIIERHSEGTLP